MHLTGQGQEGGGPACKKIGGRRARGRQRSACHHPRRAPPLTVRAKVGCTTWVAPYFRGCFERGPCSCLYENKAHKKSLATGPPPPSPVSCYSYPRSSLLVFCSHPLYLHLIPLAPHLFRILLQPPATSPSNLPLPSPRTNQGFARGACAPSTDQTRQRACTGRSTPVLLPCQPREWRTSRRGEDADTGGKGPTGGG